MYCYSQFYTSLYENTFSNDFQLMFEIELDRKVLTGPFILKNRFTRAVYFQFFGNNLPVLLEVDLNGIAAYYVVSSRWCATTQKV